MENKKKKLNLLYLHTRLPIGGAEELLLTILKYIDREIFNPFVCCMVRGDALASEVERLGITVITLGMKHKKDLTVIPKLVSLLRKKNIHIIHSSTFIPNFMGRIAATIARVPVKIITEHNIYSDKKKFHVFSDRILSYVTDRIICVSEAVKKFTEKQEGIKHKKFLVFKNFIDLEKYNFSVKADYLKNEFKLKEKQIIVGTISTLTKQKGHSTLLEAASIICNQMNNVRFLIVGDGPLRNLLEEKAKNLGISEFIIFAGARRDISELLSIMDIFAFPSLWEGFSIAILEAMAMKKPVIASRVDGISEIIKDGISGILFTPRNARELASHIFDLIRNPEIAQKLGEQARLQIEEYYDCQKNIKELENLYYQIAKDKGI